MKTFAPPIFIAPAAERPFPEKEILWGSQDGGQACFPTRSAAFERMHSIAPAPLEKFVSAVSNAQERIWIVDEYLLIADKEKSKNRIEQILYWFPLSLAASDIRLLTKPHQEVSGNDLGEIQQHARKISNHATRRGKECHIEIKMHLTRHCNYIHDRFAIVDDELWHFGGTVGVFHSKVSAASRGLRASEHGAVKFFEDMWFAGEQK